MKPGTECGRAKIARMGACRNRHFRRRAHRGDPVSCHDYDRLLYRRRAGAIPQLGGVEHSDNRGARRLRRERARRVNAEAATSLREVGMGVNLQPRRRTAIKPFSCFLCVQVGVIGPESTACSWRLVCAWSSVGPLRPGADMSMLHRRLKCAPYDSTGERSRSTASWTSRRGRRRRPRRRSSKRSRPRGRPGRSAPRCRCFSTMMTRLHHRRPHVRLARCARRAHRGLAAPSTMSWIRTAGRTRRLRRTS